MLVSTLPTTLSVATFKSHDHIKSSTHPLLQLFFFPSNDDRFFSFTASPTEISLIFESDSLSLFTDLESHTSSWKAIQVHAGASGSSNLILPKSSN